MHMLAEPASRRRGKVNAAFRIVHKACSFPCIFSVDRSAVKMRPLPGGVSGNTLLAWVSRRRYARETAFAERGFGADGSDETLGTPFAGAGAAGRHGTAPFRSRRQRHRGLRSVMVIQDIM